MLKKLKNIICNVDHFFYKKFGSDKSTKFLENIKEVQEIFAILNAQGEGTKVRFVGGCVRKSFNGENIDDIDLATSLTPSEVKKAFNEKGIRVIETGIDHGTLTAILNKKKFEITTLRKDLITDGRHATVKFTSDWESDASRRDFTINAIYADIEGRIFDPYNGLADLKKGKIKFIGLPEERIQEDYLRILRYFRFFTQYSKIDHEQDTLKSIKKYINGLNKVSNERIFDELKKILKLENINYLFSQKSSREVILNIFPQLKYFRRLIEVNNFHTKIKKRYDMTLILAILIIDESNNYEYFCHKYKTSNSIKINLKNISKNYENLKNKKFYSKKNVKKMIYFSSKKEVTDLLLFSLSLKTKIETSVIENLIHYISSCKIPKFPISGDYLKERGYIDGVNLGKKLKSLEEEWIQNNFFIDLNQLNNSLSKNSKN